MTDQTHLTDVERVRAIYRRAEGTTVEELMLMSVAAERERCAKIARNGANLFRHEPIKFVTPEKYAADLADDIADAIESGAQP